MFIDRINDTKKTLAKYKVRQEGIYGSSQFVQALDVVNNAVQEISNQIKLSAAAKLLVPDAGLSSAKKDELKSRLYQMKDDIEERENVKESGLKLKGLMLDFKKEENDKWRCSVEEKANASISLLKQLGKYSDKSDEVSSIITRLSSNASVMPVNRETILLYAKALKYAAEITNSVSGSDKVMAFLQKVSDGQATVTDLNDEIWAWIREKHMEQKFRITLQR